MKLAHAEKNVLSSHGLQQQQHFQIRTNAHAFKMLSSGLYSDKVTAVLREIGCNAYDAHVFAGVRDRPIEVKLPNRIDPQFYIKDHGPGLSHDEVMNLYTTYFASTKQTSNDFTGAFGLGSKSPFSYTDSFTVTSTHEGKKRLYSAHLDDSGSPTIALLAETDPDPDWQSGISIGFAVKPADFGEFAAKAQKVFRWFKTPPMIRGGAKIEPPEVLVQCEGAIRVSAEGVEQSVLMGNVLYPLDVNVLPHGARIAVTQVEGLVLVVPIGTVQVAASREVLQYDPKTVENLTQICAKVLSLIGDDIVDQINEFAKNDWKAKCAAKHDGSKWLSSDKWGYNDAVRTLAARSSKPVSTVDVEIFLKGGSIAAPTWLGDVTSVRYVTNDSKTVRTVVNGAITGSRYPRNLYINLVEDTVIFHGYANDAPSRLLRWANESPSTERQGIYIGLHSKTADPAAMDDQVARLRRLFNGVEVRHISTLPRAPSGKAGSYTGRRVKGAPPPPLPNKTVHSVNETFARSHTVDIATVPPAGQHFMCMMQGFHGGSDRAVRLYDKNVKKDTVFGYAPWRDIWVWFQDLQIRLQLGLPKYGIILMAETIRKLELPQRGWESTYHMIERTLKDPVVQGKVATAAMAWRPRVSLESLYYAANIVTAMTCIANENPQLWSKVKHLVPHGSDIDNILVTSKAARTSGSLVKLPPEIMLFNNLQVHFPDVKLALPSSATRGYFTPDELAAEMTDRYALLKHEVVSPLDIYRAAKEAPDKLEPLLKAVFS